MAKECKFVEKDITFSDGQAALTMEVAALLNEGWAVIGFSTIFWPYNEENRRSEGRAGDQYSQVLLAREVPDE